MNSWTIEGFEGTKNTVWYDDDICHFTVTQRHNMDSIKNEPCGKLLTLDGYNVSVQVHPW